jgi:glycosyltransferase involved in cell wall biosynthesis
MHIVIVGPAYPLRGGIAHFNATLAQELGRRHRVETVTFSKQYPALLFPGRTQQDLSAPLHAAPAPQLIDSINPLNWIRVGRQLRRRNADAFIFHYWLPFFAPCFSTIARVAARGTRTRVILICHNLLPHERFPFGETLTRAMVRSADALVVLSESVERELKEFEPGARYRNVPHPVYSLFGETIDRQSARERLGIRADRVLLFFGYIRKYKGLRTLLEAMALVPESLGVRLLVVGEFYEEAGPYHELVRMRGLESRVSFVPEYVPNETVNAYFSAADAVVLPYLSGTQSGIAQIAFNFDRPVIATSVGGLGEVVKAGETGLVVPPGDPAALADAIRQFFSRSLGETLSAGVRAAKQAYGWKRLTDAIEELATP